jgi:hypothetical protein
MHQLGITVHDYASARDSQLPPSQYYQYISASGSCLPWGLNYEPFPYVEQDNMYQQGPFANYALPVKSFVCPSDSSAPGSVAYGYGVCNYAHNWLVFGYPNGLQLLGADYATVPRYSIANIPDGTSNTVFFTERYGQCGAAGSLRDYPYLPFASVFNICNYYPIQVKPTAASCDWTLPKTPHTGGVVVGMGDGSCRSVNSAVSQATWFSALTPDDGGVPGTDWQGRSDSLNQPRPARYGPRHTLELRCFRPPNRISLAVPAPGSRRWRCPCSLWHPAALPAPTTPSPARRLSMAAGPRPTGS